MANWDSTDFNNPLHQESKAASTALSAHEKEIFEGFLQKQAGKSQAHAANDVERDTLRYLFTIFR